MAALAVGTRVPCGAKLTTSVLTFVRSIFAPALAETIQKLKPTVPSIACCTRNSRVMLLLSGFASLSARSKQGSFSAERVRILAEFYQGLGDRQHRIRLSRHGRVPSVILLVCGLELPIILTRLVARELCRAVVKTAGERDCLGSARLPTDIGVKRAFFAKKRYTQPDTSSSCLRGDGLQAGLHVRHVEIEIAGVASRYGNSARSGRAEELVLLRRVGDVSTPTCGLHLVIADILTDALENTGQRIPL